MSGMGARRAIAYTRVSTGKQAESGLGLTDQMNVLTAAVEAKGWVLAHHAKDAGASAKTLKHRPALDKALAMLDAGDADVLVAAKLDRISRSVADFATLVDRAKRKGWSVVVLDVEVDTTTPAGEFLVNVLSSAAQYERRLISDRTKAAHRVRKAQGKVPGPKPRLPDETRRLVQALKAEGHGLREIARRLNEQGVPTATPGASWHASTVRHVLASVKLEASLAASSSR